MKRFGGGFATDNYSSIRNIKTPKTYSEVFILSLVQSDLGHASNNCRSGEKHAIAPIGINSSERSI